MKVLLFLAKGFEMMEASAFIDVIGWARSDFGMDVHLTTCGFEAQVVSTFGVTVSVDARLDDVDAAAYDALAVPGGFEEYGFFEEAYDERFLQLLRDFDDAGKPIAAVCVAALPLGKSGVLAGRRATTYALDLGYRQAQLREFGVEVVSEPIAVDENVITSRGPQTAVEVAFRLLERVASPKEAALVREAMGF